MTEREPDYYEEAGLTRDQVIILIQDWSSLTHLQVTELRKAFDSFDSDKRGAISSETTGTILRMMGVRVSGEELAAIMDDIDVDKSGQLEFEKFVILSARLTEF